MGESKLKDGWFPLRRLCDASLTNTPRQTTRSIDDDFSRRGRDAESSGKKQVVETSVERWFDFDQSCVLMDKTEYVLCVHHVNVW